MTNLQFTIEKSQKALEEMARIDLFKESYWYNKDLKAWLKEMNMAKADPGMYRKYEEISVKLDFLSLNMIEDWEKIYELIREHFDKSLEIENYNLWEKVRNRLSSVYTLEERSEIKKKIKKILEGSEKNVLNRERYRNVPGMPIRVADWIRDFAANLGVGKYENIKKVNYLTRGQNIVKLTAEDKDKIKDLLELYENVSLPSDTPEGFEDDVPVDLGGGKIGIFSKGNVEEIDSKLTEMIRAIKLPPVKGEEVVATGKGSEKPASVRGVASSGADTNNELSELKQLASEYPAGSLERRAIEEEITRLNH